MGLVSHIGTEGLVGHLVGGLEDYIPDNWLPYSESGLQAWYRSTDTKPFDQPCLVDGNMEELSCATQPALVDGDMELAPPVVLVGTNMDFEGAAGPAGWGTIYGTASREAGTRTGGSGSYVGQLVFDGSHTSMRLTQTVLTVGKTYKISGWYRTDGVSSALVQDGLAGIALTLAASASWAFFTVTGVAAYSRLDLGSSSIISAGQWIQFDDITVQDTSLITDGSMELAPPASPTIVDADMEAAGIAAWTQYNAASSKQPGTRTGGSGSQVLRVTYAASAWGDAAQTILTTGHTYRVTGWYRGDGTSRPGVILGGSGSYLEGTSSTTWQSFDFVGVCAGSGVLAFYSPNLSGTHYVEFDDVAIQDLTATAYAASNSAKLSKVADPRPGSTGTLSLRVEYNGVASPAAGQVGIIIIGHTYRIQGWAKTTSAGVKPYVLNSAVAWLGAATTDWQNFDATFTAGSTSLYLAGDFGSAGYTEWDDITITDVTATAWTAGSAIVSKQTTTPHGGTYCIRVAYDGANASGSAMQNVLVVGRTYRIKGWARGDGTAIPIVRDAGNYLWTGTAVATWQPFDVTFKAAAIPLMAYTTSLAAGRYVEFDDFTLEDVSADAWTASNAIISKSNVSPHSGLRALRIAYDGTHATSQVLQTILTVGGVYHIKGWVRGDGAVVPLIVEGGTVIFTGTSSTSWQYFDVYRTAVGTYLCCQGSFMGAGNWVEMDDLTVERVYIADGDCEDVPAVQPVLVDGNMETAPPVMTPLTNGDFEGAAGPAGWTQFNSVMSRQSGQRTGGAGLYVLQILYDGVNPGGVAYSNACLVAGHTYRIQGWAKGDGTGSPSWGTGGSAQWAGTSSSTWQSFDVTVVATGTALFCYGNALSAGKLVQFDDITIVDLTATAWTNSSGVGSKQTGTPHGGTYCLRLGYDGSHATGYLTQSVGILNHTYRIRGWYRGDGSIAPRILKDGAELAYGTAVNTWQAFDVTTTFDAGTTLYLGNKNNLAAGLYVEFDDITIEDVSATYWTTTAATLSKSTALPHSGTRALRIAWATGTYAFAYNISTITVGAVYRLRGWIRSDGTQVPKVWDVTAGTVWTGTISTSWQPIDVIFKAAGAQFGALFSATGAGWIEIDDWVLEPAYINDGNMEAAKPTMSPALLNGNMEAPAASQPTLVNGNFEGAVGPAGWTAFNSTISRQSGTRTGGSGSYVGRLAFDGVNGLGLLYQAVCTVGNTYRVTGWMKTDGVAIPSLASGAGAVYWTGTASGTWQSFDVTFKAAAANLCAQCSNLAAGRYVDVDDLTIEDVTPPNWVTFYTVASIDRTNPHAGTQCLRISYNGVDSQALAYQVCLIIGHTYRITGWARSSGNTNCYPTLTDGSSTWWVGAASTTWQSFDVTFKSVGTAVGLWGFGMLAGRWCEFDDITVEDLTATAWTTFQACVSKSTASPHSGTQALRLAYDGVNQYGMVGQAYLTIGQWYRVHGWARGDGTVAPNICDNGGTSYWTGTTSTTWQEINCSFFSGTSNAIWLRNALLSAGHWVEFDDITVEPISAAGLLDLSGHTRHAYQPVLTKQPGIIPAIVNGQPVARFDGVDDFLQALFPLKQPETVIAILQYRDGTVTQKDILDGGVALSGLLYYNPGNPALHSYAGADLISALGAFGIPMVMAQVHNGVNSSIQRDGGVATTGDAGTTAMGGITIAARSPGAQFNSDCDVAEIFAYDHALSVAALRQALAYLKNKYLIP